MSNAQKLSQAVAGGQTAVQADDIGVSIQAQLVSGTNIKTINSTSLLGSGDVAIDSSSIGDIRQTNATLSASWLNCDGSQVSATTYASLAAIMPPLAFNVSGSTYERPNSGGMRIAYNGSNMYVAVDANYCSSSPDGVTWTDRITSAGNTFYGISYANGYFLIGSVNGIWYSADGITWAYSFVAESETFYSVAFGNGAYVCCTSSKVYSTTSLTSTWTQRTATNLASATLVKYLGALFFVIGSHSSGGIWTSSDGTTWTQRASGTSQFYDIAYDGSGVYVAVGASGVCYSSSNGTAWTSRSAGANTLNQVVFSNSLWVTVGDANSLYTSTDGTTWTSRTSGFPAGTSLYGLAYGNSSWAVLSNTGCLTTSTDGTTWTVQNTNVTDVDNYMGYLKPLQYLGNQFLTGSSYGAINTASSATGTWTPRRTKLFRNVAFNYTNQQTATDGTKIVIAAGTGVWVTTDNITYNFKYIGANNSSLNIGSVAYLGGVWFACGTGSAGGIWSSADTNTWTLRQSVSGGLYSVGYNGTNLYVAAGASGACYTSPDGTTWTSRTGRNSLQGDICYIGTTWVYGTGTNVTFSTNAGVTWTANNAVLQGRVKKVNGVVWHLSTSGTSIYRTTDGVSWSSAIFVTSPTVTSSVDVYYFNSKWVISFPLSASSDNSGYANVIYYSTDGYIFYPASFQGLPRRGAGKFFEIGSWLVSIGDACIFATKDGVHWQIYPTYWANAAASGQSISTLSGTTVYIDTNLHSKFSLDSTKVQLPYSLGGIAPTYIKAL